jgi:glycosyltransferase involved in cell wall biosynthesis
MRIGIDARLISGRFTGDRTYWRGLLHGLAQLSICAKDEFLLYVREMPSPDEISPLGLADNFQWRVIAGSSDRVWSILSLPAAAKRDGVDIVHVQYTVSPLFSVPVVATVHDISFKLFPELFNWRDRLLLNLTTPYSIRKARAVIGVSESTRSDLIKTYKAAPEKVFTTHLAADSRYSQLPDSEREAARKTLSQKYGIDSPFVLAVGVLQPRKNLPMLLRAFRAAKVLSKLDHKLVITGKRGWLTEGLDDALNQAQSSAADPSIILTGYVPDDDLPLLYNCADLFCYPSLYEGFGLPPLEAMACGCPVLTSNVSSLPEVVGDAGITLDPHNAGAWIDSISSTLASMEIRAAMTTRGIAQANRFNWLATAELTRAAYTFAKNGKQA